MAGFFSAKNRTAEEPTSCPPPEDPFEANLGLGTPADRVVYQVTATLLGYPSDELLRQARGLIDLARATEDQRFIEACGATVEWLVGRDTGSVRGDYVQEFDLSRRHSFHLSYWTDGDTRRRGVALARFKRMYRESGVLTDLHGELPDHLGVVLEFAAQVDAVKGRAALQAYRSSLELLRFALDDAHLPHAGLLAAVCRTLPGTSPATREEIHRIAASGPPQETVGLDGYGGVDAGLSANDPRLLPILQNASTGEQP